ncbi:RNA-directed DNA polymerase, eukaryota [Tanacetum coccineum]
MMPSLNCKTRWVKYVPIKVNVQAWKVMTDSLPTRFNISRRGICIDSILCAICNTGVETSRHLFFSCELARDVMNLIIRWWNVSSSVFESYEEWLEWFVNIRLPSKNKKMFEGVFYVTWWLLWWFRNKTIFEGKTIKKAMLFDEVIDAPPVGLPLGHRHMAHSQIRACLKDFIVPCIPNNPGSGKNNGFEALELQWVKHLPFFVTHISNET